VHVTPEVREVGARLCVNKALRNTGGCINSLACRSALGPAPINSFLERNPLFEGDQIGAAKG